MAALGHKNIRWLDVAVDDTFGVRCVQSVRDFDPQHQHLLKRERLATDAVLKRRPVQILHGDKRLPVSSPIS